MKTADGMQVYSFLHETSEVLAIKNVPSLDVLEASLFSTNLSPIKATPTATEPSSQEASAAPYVAVVVPLLQLLATDIYSVVKEQCIEKTGMVAAQERDLAAGHPIVKEENWQHVCSGIFAGACKFIVLRRYDGHPIAFIPLSIIPRKLKVRFKNQFC